MSFLLDTNVVSELRKGKRTDPAVAAWLDSVAGSEKYVSVLTLGEIRRGIELLQRRDATSARALDAWFAKLRSHYAARILAVDQAVAEEWGRLGVPDPLPIIDGYLAATAIVNGLTLVTRNVEDIKRTGVAFINPFEPEPDSK